jgi:hypothetical protein
MNPKQFLIIIGVILVLVAIGGYAGLIGPTPEKSLFHDVWWFDNIENGAHLLAGLIALTAAFSAPYELQRPLVIIGGLLGIFLAFYNLFSTQLLHANLESPADLALHLIIGIWALAASVENKRTRRKLATS